jgi:hypothetical protein
MFPGNVGEWGGRAVASMYSWGCRPKISEWRKKFPNISWPMKQRRCLLSGKWRRNLQTKKRIFYEQTYYRSMQCRRNLFLIGAKNEVKGPKKFLNLESLIWHFLDFGKVLTEFWWSENSVLICRNLQYTCNFVVLNGRRRIHFTIYWGSCKKVWIIWFFAVCHG